MLEYLQIITTYDAYDLFLCVHLRSHVILNNCTRSNFYCTNTPNVNPETLKIILEDLQITTTYTDKYIFLYSWCFGYFRMCLDKSIDISLIQSTARSYKYTIEEVRQKAIMLNKMQDIKYFHQAQ